jgi:hypothetical protein
MGNRATFAPHKSAELASPDLWALVERERWQDILPRRA